MKSGFYPSATRALDLIRPLNTEGADMSKYSIQLFHSFSYVSCMRARSISFHLSALGSKNLVSTSQPTVNY